MHTPIKLVQYTQQSLNESSNVQYFKYNLCGRCCFYNFTESAHLYVVGFAVTHFAKVAFLWRWDTFILTVRRWWRRWEVITASRVSRGRAHRKRGRPPRCSPPVWAVTLTVQALTAARPLLFAHPLPLHSLAQEAVVIIISPAPGAAIIPAIPVHLHQVITAAAASPRKATIGSSFSSPTADGGVISTAAVIKVPAVAAAGTAAPLIIRATEIKQVKGKQKHEVNLEPHCFAVTIYTSDVCSAVIVILCFDMT